jgi:small multidrug resistance pump
MSLVLYAAAADNLAWGAFVVLLPHALFRWAGAPSPNYPGLWQCVGMLVGVLGVGYWAAARDPVGHWPIVLVGLLDGVFGAVGFAGAALGGEIPWSFGAAIAANAIVWWVPFTLILLRAYRRRAIPLRPAHDHESLRRA